MVIFTNSKETKPKQRAVPNHPCHEEQMEVSNEYGKAILKVKHQHWTDFLEEVADHELWTANRYLIEPAGNRGSVRGCSASSDISSNISLSPLYIPPHRH